jgi:hypothetical protein
MKPIEIEYSITRLLSLLYGLYRWSIGSKGYIIIYGSILIFINLPHDIGIYYSVIDRFSLSYFTLKPHFNASIEKKWSDIEIEKIIIILYTN